MKDEAILKLLEQYIDSGIFDQERKLLINETALKSQLTIPVF